MLVVATLHHTAESGEKSLDQEMGKYMEYLTAAFQATKLFNQLVPETQEYLLQELGKLLVQIKNKLKTPRNSGFTSRTLDGNIIHGKQVRIMFTSAFSRFSEYVTANTVLSDTKITAARKRSRKAPRPQKFIDRRNRW